MNASLITSIGAVVLALLVIVIRLRAAKKPTSLKKILLPPLGMSMGFLMFIVPQTHIPWIYATISFLVGCAFSYPLIHTSHFVIHEGNVYLKRSKAFPLILLGLLVVRMVIHGYVEAYVSLPQTGACFFILAFGMILPWRIAMYVRYSQVNANMTSAHEKVAANLHLPLYQMSATLKK